MSRLTDLFQGSANDTATGATNAALDSAAARPFNVVLSVAPDTQLWIATLMLVGAVAGVLLKKYKP